MNMLQTSGFITKSREIWWNFAERNVSFETSSPFSFCSPAFFCMSTRTPNFFFYFIFETPQFPRFPAFQWFYSFPLNKRDLSLRKLEKLTVFCWLKNGPRMKMSILSYWKRGCSSCLPYPSLLLTKRVSQSPMISDILKDLESDVTEVPWVFPRTAGCRGGNHRVTTRMPWNNFWGHKGSQQEKTDSLATSFFFFASGGGLSGSISNEDESIILFVYVAFRLVTCC